MYNNPYGPSNITQSFERSIIIKQKTGCYIDLINTNDLSILTIHCF